LTDDDAVAAAVAGDRAALESLLERHADRVYAVCRRVLSDPDDALDATQEALIAIARSITSFDRRSAFSTWVYRVATNAALDEARRKNRRPIPTETVAEIAAPGSVEARVAATIDVGSALTRVPEEFRVALVLRDACDLEYSDIAEVLDVPIGTVRSRIARGRKALAAALGNQSGAPQRPTPEHP
jgi:RNA polymerase sigma-70 factor, ECF subfamily